MVLSLGSSCSLFPAESLVTQLAVDVLALCKEGIATRQPLSWGSSHFPPPRAQPAAAQELPAPDMLLSRTPCKGRLHKHRSQACGGTSRKFLSLAGVLLSIHQRHKDLWLEVGGVEKWQEQLEVV